PAKAPALRSQCHPSGSSGLSPRWIPFSYGTGIVCFFVSDIEINVLQTCPAGCHEPLLAVNKSEGARSLRAQKTRLRSTWHWRAWTFGTPELEHQPQTKLSLTRISLQSGYLACSLAD